MASILTIKVGATAYQRDTGKRWNVASVAPRYVHIRSCASGIGFVVGWDDFETDFSSTADGSGGWREPAPAARDHHRRQAVALIRPDVVYSVCTGSRVSYYSFYLASKPVVLPRWEDLF